MKTPASSTARKRREAKPAPAPEQSPLIDPAPAPDEPLAFNDDGIKRVQDIIRNARATWFALLGALVFASVTLASVKDISFFVNSVETKLPIVGISVPVVSFFWAGSLLIAALYAYFHLYLELLWQALGDFPARDENGALLADRIEPWIVADTALRFRDWLRGAHGRERASRRRSMQVISDVVSVGLVWLFGLVVTFWFWWRSMPAHEPLLTGFLGVVFAVTLWVFGKSAAAANAHLGDKTAKSLWKLLFASAIVLIAALTTVRTWIDPWQGQPRDSAFFNDLDPGWFIWPPEFLRPARAIFREVVVTEKPKDWVGKEVAEVEFRVRWCKERDEPKCLNPLALENRRFDQAGEKSFQAAWGERWKALLAQMPKPDLRGKDLRGADLAFAKLEGADLSNAQLEGANLRDIRLEGARVVYASLAGTYLLGARLEGADFRSADFTGANLSQARLEGTELFDAQLVSVNLISARLEGSKLLSTRFINADLTAARLFGSRGSRLDLGRTFFHGSFFRATAFRHADLSSVDITNNSDFIRSFGDASVMLPPLVETPCHWAKTELSDEEYFGRWKGWIDTISVTAYLPDLDAYPPIPPPPGCVPPPAAP